MSSSTTDIQSPLARGVQVAGDRLSVTLSDGRTISAPIAWHPRLAHANWLWKRYVQGVKCPNCGRTLRTPQAKLRLKCGADWHDTPS